MKRVCLALALVLTGPAMGQDARKPFVVIEHFETSVQDSVLRAATDRMAASLGGALAADTTIRLLASGTAPAKRPAGVTYRLNGGTSPRRDGSLRLDWALTSMDTRAVLVRDSAIVRPSREHLVISMVAARVSAALRAKR